MSETNAKLLTVAEVAATLKVSRETARKLMATGRLPYVAVGTGSSRKLRRVNPATLAAYLQDERRDAIKQQMHDVRRTRAAMRLVEQRW